MEQTVYLGSGSTTDVVVYTQAINSSGSHVALVVNTSTSKLVFADGTVSSATPTVASLGTGKAKVTFASIANSSLSAGDTVAVRLNGTADGVAFSEYMIPVFIATASSGGGSSLTQADIRTAVGLASANLDTQLGDIPTVTEFNARTKPTADYFDHTADQVVASNMRGTDNAILASSAPTNWGSLSINSSGHIVRVVLTDTTTTNSDMVDISSLATASNLAVVDGVVDAIKLKTDQLTFTVSNQVDSNALTGGGGDDAATIYSYFTASNREDQFKSDVSALATAASIAALNDISAADVWTYSTRTITSGGITQSEVADAVWNASLSGYNSGGSTGKALKQIKEGVISTDGSVDDTSATSTTFISNLSETTDGFYHDKVIVFISGDLLGQARHIETYVGSTKSITVSQGFTSAPSDGDEFLILSTHEHSLNEISESAYSYFTDSNREDQFKSDVSGLATSSDLATVDSNVDSIKAITDQMVFTVSGQIDANALTGGGGDDAATIYSYFTASNREDQFKADVSSISQLGSGAISHEITVNVGGSPSDGVEVWVSTDASGNNVVAGTLVTDAFGKATFMLDAGSYYLWAQKAGTNFTNPTTFSVS